MKTNSAFRLFMFGLISLEACQRGKSATLTYSQAYQANLHKVGISSTNADAESLPTFDNSYGDVTSVQANSDQQFSETIAEQIVQPTGYYNATSASVSAYFILEFGLGAYGGTDTTSQNFYSSQAGSLGSTFNFSFSNDLKTGASLDLSGHNGNWLYYSNAYGYSSIKWGVLLYMLGNNGSWLATNSTLYDSSGRTLATQVSTSYATTAFSAPSVISETFTYTPGSSAGNTISANYATTISGGDMPLTAFKYNAVTISATNVLTVSDPPSGNHADRSVLVAGALSISGTTDGWTSQLDLKGNDMVVQGGSLAQITNQIMAGYSGGSWAGQGITSSDAANDTTHLTALGVLQNNDGNGNPIFSTFDGVASTSNDVLVKYTYYGDANLDGKVDGSDYTLIDNGYLQHLTGWRNGDFNYDGVVDGSDYSLIDNAFNNQTANLSTAALVATSTAEPAAVPEPTTLAALGACLLGKPTRRARRQPRGD